MKTRLVDVVLKIRVEVDSWVEPADDDTAIYDAEEFLRRTLDEARDDLVSIRSFEFILAASVDDR